MLVEEPGEQGSALNLVLLVEDVLEELRVAREIPTAAHESRGVEWRAEMALGDGVLEERARRARPEDRDPLLRIA